MSIYLQVCSPGRIPGTNAPLGGEQRVVADLGDVLEGEPAAAESIGGHVHGDGRRLLEEERDGDVGERLSTALEKLGAVWIKLGQILATRPDIVGILPAKALSGLKDKVAPFDTNIAKQILANEFCDGNLNQINEIFGDIGELVAGGIGCASI